MQFLYQTRRHSAQGKLEDCTIDDVQRQPLINIIPDKTNLTITIERQNDIYYIIGENIALEKIEAQPNYYIKIIPDRIHFFIRIIPDKVKLTITIEDSGNMMKNEMINNLGIIAKSTAVLS
eukprot:13262582-Heterocapsa_arctica.AAC.1